MPDLVITDATLVDGTGTPPRPADVVVTDGLITEVTEPGRASIIGAHRVIDAGGSLVTPGFVDVHT
ncbi:MAG: D-aminoacylase, partial [Actinomycetota bacterium]